MNMEKIDIEEISKNDSNDIQNNNIDVRIMNSFGNVIGRQFEKGDKISLIYNAPDGRIINYIFDTNDNKILINNRIFIIKPLEGTIINKIEFTDNKFIIYGKMGIIDGKVEATYKKTIKSIDEIYSYTKKNK